MRFSTFVTLAIPLLFGGCQRAATTPAPVRHASVSSDALPETGTFSIIAYDTATGEWGGAVQSRVFSVGNGVLWAEAGAGMAATQAVVDVSYGPQALALLRQGKSAADVVKWVWEHDPDADTARWSKTGRQFAVVATSQLPLVLPSQVSAGTNGPLVKTISIELFATLLEM